MRPKLCTVGELYICEFCKIFIGALIWEKGKTKKFYTESFNEEEVRFLQSDKGRTS